MHLLLGQICSVLRCLLPNFWVICKVVPNLSLSIPFYSLDVLLVCVWSIFAVRGGERGILAEEVDGLKTTRFLGDCYDPF